MNTFRFALLPLLATAALPAQEPNGPKFTTGDLATLDCKVVDVKAIDEYCQLLTVDVHNRGPVAAEPLEFRIEVPDKKPNPPKAETFARVPLPRIARYGRPVPTGGKQSYVLSTALAGKRPQFTVRVAQASFVEGGVVPKPDLKIGKPVQVQRTSLAGAFPVTQVTLQNPLARDLDVLLLVTLEQPRDTVELYGVRLPARGTLDWVLTSRPGNRPYVDQSGGPGGPLKAVSFRVVDWSLAAPADGVAGAAMLQAAYEAWYRWPEADPQVAGDFTFRERRQRPNAPDAYDDFSVRGRFTVSREGKLGVEIAQGEGADARLLLESALENVRRPDFATLAKRNELVPLAADRVATRGPGWDWQQDARTASVGSGGDQVAEWKDLQVRGGRIVSDGVGDGVRTAWVTQTMGAGYVVTRRHGTSIDTRYAYREQDGRIVPSAVTSTTTFGEKLYSASELVLTNLRFEGVEPIVPQPPQGDGVAALRAMWDGAFRLTSDPVEIRAQFEVQTPGTDLVWQGHKRLRGKLVMKGIGRHMRSAEFEFDGNLPQQVEMSLAAIVRDRLLMWYGRDFNARPSFDEFFRGAVVHAPTPAGDFAVENCRVDRVSTEAGQVRGWNETGGGSTKFSRQKVGEVQVVTRVDEVVGTPQSRSQDRWNSSVQITMAKVGDLVLPTQFVFEQIFGRDWGPETIVLKGLEVR